MPPDLPELRTSTDGVILPVRAQPGARRNAITGVHDGRLKVAVTQAPEKGKANSALVALLAGELGISRSQITLVRGETTSQKDFSITGIATAALEQRLLQILEDANRSGRR